MAIATTLILSVTPSSLMLKTGLGFRARASLIDADGNSLSSKAVTIRVRLPSGTLKSFPCVTNYYGQCEVSYGPDAEGSYVWYAEYGGNGLYSEYAPSRSADVTTTVTPYSIPWKNIYPNRYVISFQSETAKEFASQAASTLPCPFDIDLEAVRLKALESIDAAVVQELEKAGLEQGYTWVLVDIVDKAAEITKRSNKYPSPSGGYYKEYAKLSMKANVAFESDKPLTASPLDPLTLAFLAKVISIIVGAIVTIVVAWMVIQAAKEWLQSMTTTTRTITYTYHDVDPDSPTYCQTMTKTETITEPSPTGILTVGIVLIIVVIVVMMLMGFRGR